MTSKRATMMKKKATPSKTIKVAVGFNLDSDGEVDICDIYRTDDPRDAIIPDYEHCFIIEVPAPVSRKNKPLKVFKL
jgi:hypothetical protein